MKKQYVKPVVSEQHVHTESLLYTTSIQYGGDPNPDNPPEQEAKRNGLLFLDVDKLSGKRLWEDEDDTENADDFWN